MIWKVRVERSDDSVSASLPAELIDRLQIGDRDEITAIETEGGVLLTAGGEDITESIRLYQQVREKYDRAFERLAR